MDQQQIQPRGQKRTIVDIQTGKRRIDQPQEKIPTLIDPQYNNEGTYSDILELLTAKFLHEEKGVFLKGKNIDPAKDEVEKHLKNGGFSKQILLYKNKEKSYVCKQIDAKKFNQNEVISMCQLNDEYISQIYGLVRTTSEYHIYMEYCGTNLLELTGMLSFTMDQMIEITKKICMAVEFAHNRRILHLDIKPENICMLFTKNGFLLKLTDWGSSRPDNGSTNGLNITSYYASPEILYLYIRQAMVSSTFQENATLLAKAIELTQKFSQNYNNIETVSTKADSFSIGMAIMFVKTRKYIYDEQERYSNPLYLIQKFAENPDAAKDKLPVSGDFLTLIARNLVQGDSHKRSSVKELQIMINDNQRRNIDSNLEIIPNITEPVPEEECYNIPYFDLLF